MKHLYFLAAVCTVIFAHELEISFTNIKVEKGGNIIVAICEPDKKFPCNKDNAYKAKRVKVMQDSAKVTFELPDGTYAVVAGHDENENDIIDRNFIGIPVEGYAISGKPSFGMPKFENAKFTINSDTKISLQMKY